MIRFFIKNGNDSVKFDAPTGELFDHLGNIGINEDIPITCCEKVYLDFYPTDDNDEIVKIVCDRLLPEDKISDVNRLCARLVSSFNIQHQKIKFKSALHRKAFTEFIKTYYRKLCLIGYAKRFHRLSIQSPVPLAAAAKRGK